MREIDSYEIYWDESANRNISSYVVKTSSGKRNILMLSTLRPCLGTTKDDGKKNQHSRNCMTSLKGVPMLLTRKLMHTV